MKKICKTCQYYRLQKVDAPMMPEAPWCSNSKSEHHMKSVQLGGGCKKWEKAMRFLRKYKQKSRTLTR